MFHVVLVFAFLKLDVMEQLCQYYKQLMIYQLKQLISYTTKNCINHKTQVGSISSQKFQSGLHNKLLGHVKLHLLVYISLGERDRKSTRLNSSHVPISYTFICLKK